MLTTTQEVFDKVAVHLLTQNKKSRRGKSRIGNTCAYRGNNGLSCAVGSIIDDKYYTLTIEGKNINSLDVQKVLSHSVDVKNGEILDLLAELQHIHDTKQVERWFGELHDLAKRSGVNTTALPKHQGY